MGLPLLGIPTIMSKPNGVDTARLGSGIPGYPQGNITAFERRKWVWYLAPALRISAALLELCWDAPW